MEEINNKLIWKCKDTIFSLGQRTLIMGVLNVTPDSFSDGGKYNRVEQAVEHALKLVKDGADILDIGGESTRPGAEPVNGNQEIDRVLPVIEELVQQTSVPISIDTYKSNVANAALLAGAKIVNDISGFNFDPNMPIVTKRHSAGCVLMHIKGSPRNMQSNPGYKNVLGEIGEYLNSCIHTANQHGISDEHIVIDPGIGFGKRLKDNLEIIRDLAKLKASRRPILVGPSRKSFIGKILQTKTDERLEGTASAVAISILNGANIVRVHDVKEIKRVALVVDAIRQGGQYS